MKLNLLMIVVLAGLAGHAAAWSSELAAGRAYYGAGEFRKTPVHFQLGLKASAGDAEACYWTGLSCQRLAEVSTPFSGRYNSRARLLTKAVKLAPDRPDYRLALFDFLLDPADSSRTALRQAARVLETISESDPDIGPRALYRVVGGLGSALSSLHIAASSPEH